MKKMDYRHTNSFGKWVWVLFPILAYLMAHTLLGSLFLWAMPWQPGYARILGVWLLCPGILLVYRKKAPKQLSLDRRGYLPALFGLVAAVVGLSLTAAFVSRFTTQISASPVSYSLFEVVTLAVAAPINEELIYRGFGLERCRTAMGTQKAILFSSMLFGVAHTQTNILLSFVAGLVFCWVYSTSGTIWAAVLAHMGVNGLSFWQPMYQLPLWVYGLGVICTGCVVGSLFHKKARQPDK